MANSQDGWSYDALHRASVIGRQTYIRASTRVVDWPKEKQRRKHEQPAKCATLENAFQNIMKCMEETTRQCQGYYGSHPPRKLVEQKHCCRFHTAEKLPQNVNNIGRDLNVCCNPDQCGQRYQ